MTIQQSKLDLIEALSIFPSWTEKYEYIIDLGKMLPPADELLKTKEYLIEGCQSQVWVNGKLNGNVMIYAADSDSVIVKGMIALFLTVYQQQDPQAILNDDMEQLIEQLNLKQHLAPTRANALHLMVKRIKKLAFDSLK